MVKNLVRGDVTNRYLITKYYDAIKDKKIICKLCPNMCVITDGNAGLCHARINIDGKFYSTVYGYPCSLHIDPIEKKPLYHYYPGHKILSFGTYGCNLFCKGCQNFDITRVDASDSHEFRNLKHYTPKEIVDTAVRNNIKLIAYTYNEPTIFFEYMIDIAKLARKRGIKNVIVSNGYINSEPLKELCKYIDAANIDLKGITETFYKEYTKTHLKPVLQTIKLLHKKGIWLELTNLMIPNVNDAPSDTKELCEWIKDNVGVDVPIHFSRFYPHYQASNIPPTDPKQLVAAKKIASDIGIRYVYIGNLGFLDHTYCTKCGSILIERDYEHLTMTGLAHKNKCAKCKSILPGIFE